MSLDPGFTTSESLRIFGFGNRLVKMLDVEAALAEASAAAGIVPLAAAESIRNRFSAPALTRRDETRQASTR